MADITIDVNWEILPAREVIGNDANRFDTWRQSDTLGPEPPPAQSGPPETDGDPSTGYPAGS